MFGNGAKQRFAAIRGQGRTPMGLFVGSSDPAITEVVAGAGYDFAVYDCEHSPNGAAETLAHVRSAELCGLIPLARVWENSRSLIQKFLDVGVEGIVVPHVDTAEQAAAAVAATRMPPRGVRSMCGSVHATRYGTVDWEEHLRHCAENFLVIPIIESRAGVANIDEIFAVDGIDYAFFGPGDYGCDAGVPVISPQVTAAWDQVLAAARKHGKQTMTMHMTAAPGQAGALMVNMDLGAIATALRSELKQVTERHSPLAAPAT